MGQLQAESLSWASVPHISSSTHQAHPSEPAAPVHSAHESCSRQATAHESKPQSGAGHEPETPPQGPDFDPGRQDFEDAQYPQTGSATHSAHPWCALQSGHTDSRHAGQFEYSSGA